MKPAAAIICAASVAATISGAAVWFGKPLLFSSTAMAQTPDRQSVYCIPGPTKEFNKELKEKCRAGDIVWQEVPTLYHAQFAPVFCDYSRAIIVSGGAFSCTYIGYQRTSPK